MNLKLKESILNRLEKICFDLDVSHYCVDSARIVVDAMRLEWEIMKFEHEQEKEISPVDKFKSMCAMESYIRKSIDHDKAIDNCPCTGCENKRRGLE